MPSTFTITTFYNFTSGTILTSEMNANFDTWRGHVLPVDPSLTALANMSYDLGSYDHAWRNVYSRGNIFLSTVTGDLTTTTTSYNVFIDSSDGLLKLNYNTTTAQKVALFSGSTQTVTNKDIDGGTATNSNRITVPKDTYANISALTRKAGNVYFATDEGKYYGDNSTTLIGIGGGSWATSSQTLASGGYISLTASEVNQMITVTGNTTTGSTLTTTLFGNSAPTAGTFCRVIGGSNTLPVYIVASDTTYGAIGNFSSIEFGYGTSKSFQYNATLQRWVYGE